MARRREPSFFDAIYELVTLMPWWAGLVAAVVSYLALHWLAAPVAAGPVTAQNVGNFATGAILRAAANVAQYIVPLICIAGAIASALQRSRPKAVMRDVIASKAADKLDGISWADFELLVGEAFRLDGFVVEERGGAQADGGIDLVLRRGGEKFLVQCKQWRAQKVGVAIVRELFGVMAARGATGGFVVTSGAFTADAQEFASGRNVVLIDGPILLDMIERAERALFSNPHPASAARMTAPAGDAVACSLCGSAMVRRTAGRGPNAGSEFWGCSRFPGCRGTRG